MRSFAVFYSFPPLRSSRQKGKLDTIIILSILVNFNVRVRPREVSVRFRYNRFGPRVGF